MQTLPASSFIFPDPIEVDPEGEGLICVGADLSPAMNRTGFVGDQLS